jgi:hypothetical protein
MRPFEEAAIIVYMGGFKFFNKSIQQNVARVIAKRGTLYTGILYRGQPFSNPTIKSKYPFFSASKDFYQAHSFSASEGGNGNVFLMHCDRVKVFDLTRVEFTNTLDVKNACRLMLPDMSDGFFEVWWKNRNWVENQKKESEVLVLNQLKFKNPGGYTCSKQKSRKWCRETPLLIQTNVTRAR